MNAKPSTIVVGANALTRTSIRYRLARRSHVTVTINRNNTAVRTLYRGSQRRGHQRIVWDGNGNTAQPVAPGTYSVVLKVRGPHNHRALVRRARITVRAATPLFARWPLTGEVSSYFGPRGSGFHAGIDILGSTGAPVVAPAAGTVTKVGYNGNYGETVVIEHPQLAHDTLYAHLSGYAVTTGAQVAEGQVIGYVGRTGNATTAHLHFELRRADGASIDPLPTLPPR